LCGTACFEAVLFEFRARPTSKPDHTTGSLLVYGRAKRSRVTLRGKRGCLPRGGTGGRTTVRRPGLLDGTGILPAFPKPAGCNRFLRVWKSFGPAARRCRFCGMFRQGRAAPFVPARIVASLWIHSISSDHQGLPLRTAPENSDIAEHDRPETAPIPHFHQPQGASPRVTADVDAQLQISPAPPLQRPSPQPDVTTSAAP